MRWFSLGEKVGAAVGGILGGVVGTGLGIVTRGHGFRGFVPCVLAGAGIGATLGDKIEKTIKTLA